MTGLKHIKMIVTSPFWTWLISLFSALAVKVKINGIFFFGKEFKWEKWVNKWHMILALLPLCDLKYRCCECRDVQTNAELWNHPKNDRRVWWGNGLLHHFIRSVKSHVFMAENHRWLLKSIWIHLLKFFFVPLNWLSWTGQWWLSTNVVRTTVEEIPRKLLRFYCCSGSSLSVQHHLRWVHDGYGHLSAHWPVWLPGQSIQAYKHTCR